MAWKVVFFVLATTILSFARRGNAFVHLPYEDLQSNIADKYGDEIVQRNVDVRNSSGMF